MMELSRPTARFCFHFENGPVLQTQQLPNTQHNNKKHDLQSLLSQYRFCAAGIGLGTAYALRYKKGLLPMAVAGAMGTSVDMIYGYLVECAEFRQPSSPSSSSSGGGGGGP
jgi:hypothetical protein